MMGIRVSQGEFERLRGFRGMGATDATVVAIPPDEKSKLQQAKDVVLETLTIRTQTDKMIDSLTNKDARAKYVGKRLSIRNSFQSTVGEVIQKFLSLADEVKGMMTPTEIPKPKTIFARAPAGKFGSYDGDDMGIFPVFGIAWMTTAGVKVAIVALALAILAGAVYFASSNAAEKSLQQEILNDKALPTSDKVALIEAVSGGSGIAGKALPWLLLLGVGAYVYNQYGKRSA